MIPQAYIALAIAAASFAAGWSAQGWRRDAATLSAAQSSAKELADKARNTHRLQEVRDAENLRTGDLLADALERLRKRPAVRLVETPASCAGASPAAISAEDAGVALRLAAEADRLRADYQACREWAESVSK